MQSRRLSLLESVTNTVTGYGISVAIWVLVMPFFGFSPSIGEGFLFTAIFAVVSIARNYVVRRVFANLNRQ